MKPLLFVGLLAAAACEVGENFDQTLHHTVTVAIPPGATCAVDPCAVAVPFTAKVADMAAWHDQVMQAIADAGHDPGAVTVQIQAVALSIDAADVVDATGAHVAAVRLGAWRAALATAAGPLADLGGAGGPPTPPAAFDGDGVARTDIAFHTGAPVAATGVVGMAASSTAARAIATATGARLRVKLTFKLHIDVRESLW